MEKEGLARVPLATCFKLPLTSTNYLHLWFGPLMEFHCTMIYIGSLNL